MEIGIIGYGVVGKAISNTLSRKYKITTYDKYQSLDDFDNLIRCEIVFISVPTPFDCALKRVDLSAIEESLSKLESIGFSGYVIIKSTVPPGTSDKFSKKFNFDLVFNPEFLRESQTPNEDFENQDTIVIGAKTSDLFDKIKKMYEQVAIPSAQYYHTSLIEAEMIKCAQNTMLASRVAIANMIFDACEIHLVNYEKIKEIAFDRFEILGPHMTTVPGPDGKRGFGGKCLPKDIRAFSSIHNSDLLNKIISYNDGLRDDLHKFIDNFSKD